MNSSIPLTEVANLYSEQRAIRVKRIVDRKRTYVVIHSYTQYNSTYDDLILFLSSRLQPEKYRRLLGSSGGRTSSIFNNSGTSLGTIDREPSPTQCVTPDSDGGDTGEGGSEGEEEEEEVRGDEGRSGTLRNRWRGQRGGRETGELNIVITSRASISYNIGVWTP